MNLPHKFPHPTAALQTKLYDPPASTCWISTISMEKTSATIQYAMPDQINTGQNPSQDIILPPSLSNPHPPHPARRHHNHPNPVRPTNRPFFHLAKTSTFAAPLLACKDDARWQCATRQCMLILRSNTSHSPNLPETKTISPSLPVRPITQT